MSERRPCHGAHTPTQPAISAANTEDRTDEAPSDDMVEEVFAAASHGAPFGPLYFLTQLRAFVRDRCPEPDDGLPVVEVRLVDGAVLDLCHVIGVAPRWVALAVNDERVDEGPRRMRTEFVPYGTIVRVTLRPSRDEAPTIGFSQLVAPRLIESPNRSDHDAESAVAAAAGLRIDS